MFNLFKKPKGTKITLKLDGLHCVSCSLNIDGELGELKGVITSSTSYARQESVITYDPAQTDPKKFVLVIESLGYRVKN